MHDRAFCSSRRQRQHALLALCRTKGEESDAAAAGEDGGDEVAEAAYKQALAANEHNRKTAKRKNKAQRVRVGT
jgi:hypothetical protein